jgi:hypothetical protein
VVRCSSAAAHGMRRSADVLLFVLRERWHSCPGCTARSVARSAPHSLSRGNNGGARRHCSGGDHGASWCVKLTTRAVRVLQAHVGDVNCVRWRPAVAGDKAPPDAPLMLASAGDDCFIKLWAFTPPPPSVNYIMNVT